jgi:hypothetical protein
MKKIALIIFNYFLGNSLSLINATTRLANEGFDIHIFIDRFFYERSEAHFDGGNISIHPIEIAEHPHEKTIAKSRWDAFVTGMRQNGGTRNRSVRGQCSLMGLVCFIRQCANSNRKRVLKYYRSATLSSHELIRLRQ